MFSAPFAAQSPETPRGYKRPREPETISPRSIAAESYGTQAPAFSSGYVFSSAHPMPVQDLYRSPRRPSLHTQFLPPADTPPDLLPQDAAGIPSSASSTSYSPASDFSRTRSHLASPGVDWAEHARLFAQSAFPAPSDVLAASIEAGGPAASAVAEPEGLYSYAGRATGLFVADVGYEECLPVSGLA